MQRASPGGSRIVQETGFSLTFLELHQLMRSGIQVENPSTKQPRPTPTAAISVEAEANSHPGSTANH